MSIAYVSLHCYDVWLTVLSHFLFAAALVVMSSEFASLHKNPAYAETFQKAMSVTNYCAKSDPQAGRLVYILTTFNHVIVTRNPAVSTTLPDPPSVPNTPTGNISNSSNDPMANFFLSHPPNPSIPTSNPGSAAFAPITSQAQQPQAPQPPNLPRRNSNNIAPSPSPSNMPSAPTPTASAGGDMLSDAEWFHFDNLWEAWAPLSGPGNGATTAAAVTDPALFNDTSLNNFGVSGDAPTPTFATPSMPPGTMDGRFNGSGGMQVPLYPMMRFTE